MRRCRPLLGTFVEIDCGVAQAIEAGFAAVEHVHRLMSAHDPGSELSRINRLAHRSPVKVGPETAEVIQHALRWSRRSGGLFDVVRAGASSLSRNALPLHSGQPQPDAAATWAAVTIDGRWVSLALPACLDLGGIAKGHAVDCAVAAMIKAGSKGGLVNAGGDLRAFGPEAQWIDIVEPRKRHPVARVGLVNSALATSAGLNGPEGLTFEHLPAGDAGWASVTVRAPTACDADALTKIVWTAGLDSAELLAEVGAEAFAIHRDGTLQPIGHDRLAA